MQLLGCIRVDLSETFEKVPAGDCARLTTIANYIYRLGRQYADALSPRRLVLESAPVTPQRWHLMTQTPPFDREGWRSGEGLMDAMSQHCLAMHDLRKRPECAFPIALVYVVKPNMQRAPRVAFADRDFYPGRDLRWGCAQLPSKLGIMDEERRTSVNLAMSASQSPRLLFQHGVPRHARATKFHFDEAGANGAQGEMKKRAVDQCL